MLNKINQMKKLLEELLETHDLNDEVVLEVSHKLDSLILEYYAINHNDVKPNFNDKDYRKKKQKIQ